ncbi:guanine nucleotide-binding protein subunit beta-like isoform X2 [Asparagus officinalis]|uniref:guanine nucleotide-binding protein subunit beta-like isoform X2 n=1 Tax=Asparagus officinalis TaxID=4686 RepID=UPI00098DE2A8|nr:guanine nucleotide-binding protein subunit beta-like isoform X2 [Asparagus officinalis]
MLSPFSVSINSSNSNIFVSGSCDATARLWDTRIASRAIRTYHGHEGDVNAVKFFPDGQRFGTGSDDGTCRLFDMRTGHQLQVYGQRHEDNDNDAPIVTSIAFSISGRLLFAGYSNGSLGLGIPAKLTRRKNKLPGSFAGWQCLVHRKLG